MSKNTGFTCDGSYNADLKEYTEQILEKSGVSSQSAEREIMYMSNQGNTVATKLYADLVFYKKIMRRNPYREAFYLYLKSAGITISDTGEWSNSGVSYPLSFLQNVSQELKEFCRHLKVHTLSRWQLMRRKNAEKQVRTRQ